ncbi:MAG: PHB depolymerase family esterase [Ktedonobacteraceae bacterium]|nr:PHB depolymerase family esterase [Ktedonobacteraceae bacterium]
MKQYTYSGPTGERPYFVYVPQNYQASEAVPLVVMLHGCTQKANEFATGTHMNELAERNNFLVVYPQQTRAAHNYYCWNWFQPINQERNSGEAALLAGIVQEMVQQTTQWTIDKRRIYVAGISAGGAMAAILGATYPDLFAAVGIHSGITYKSAQNVRSGMRVMRHGGPDSIVQGDFIQAAMREHARVVPTIVFHGTNDFTVAPINGDQVVQQWMQSNMLVSHGAYRADFQKPDSIITGKVPGGRSYEILTWNDGSGHPIQEYWKINGMGHAWSGGNGGSYTDVKGPDASEAMYRFFIQHSLQDSKQDSVTITAALRPSFWSNLVHHTIHLLQEKKEGK